MFDKVLKLEILILRAFIRIRDLLLFLEMQNNFLRPETVHYKHNLNEQMKKTDGHKKPIRTKIRPNLVTKMLKK